MAVSLSYNFLAKATETLELGLDLGANPTVVHEITEDASGTLDANSTPVATVPWSDTITLTGGTDTLDLTALVNGNGTKVPTDMTGLKVQFIKLHTNGNTGTTTVDPGATNGYDFNLAAGGVAVGTTGQIMLKQDETLPDVSATVKTIDISGTASDTLDILIVAG